LSFPLGSSITGTSSVLFAFLNLFHHWDAPVLHENATDSFEVILNEVVNCGQALPQGAFAGGTLLIVENTCDFDTSQHQIRILIDDFKKLTANIEADVIKCVLSCSLELAENAGLDI
jgi:hypothetical protein